MILANTSWYVIRSSGLLAWVLVTTSMLWGLALSTRLVRRKGAPAWLLDLHRFLGVLSIIFTGIHVFTLTIDGFMRFSIVDVLVPMAADKKGLTQISLAWGVVGFYLLLAVQFTSWARRYLPRKVWHGIHLASFPLFVFTTLHGLQAGADRTNLVVRWAGLTGSMLLIFFIGARIGIRQNKRRVTSPVA